MNIIWVYGYLVIIVRQIHFAEHTAMIQVCSKILDMGDRVLVWHHDIIRYL